MAGLVRIVRGGRVVRGVSGRGAEGGGEGGRGVLGQQANGGGCQQGNGGRQPRGHEEEGVAVSRGVEGEEELCEESAREANEALRGKERKGGMTLGRDRCCC